MSVSSEISLNHILRELKEASSFLEKTNIQLDDSMLHRDNLVFHVKIRASKDDELYIVEFRCDDYRHLPPYVEMIDPNTGEAGVKSAYPKDLFHPHLCICARFNRKTYQEHSGLHKKWNYGDWQNEVSTNHLGGMISHIYNAIQGRMNGKPYKGRMQ